MLTILLCSANWPGHQPSRSLSPWPWSTPSYGGSSTALPLASSSPQSSASQAPPSSSASTPRSYQPPPASSTTPSPTATTTTLAAAAATPSTATYPPRSAAWRATKPSRRACGCSACSSAAAFALETLGGGLRGTRLLVSRDAGVVCDDVLPES